MKKLIVIISIPLFLLQSAVSAATVNGGGESSYKVRIHAGGENSQRENIKPDGGGESS